MLIQLRQFCFYTEGKEETYEQCVEYRAGLLETREDALYRVNLDNYISPIPLLGGGWLFFTDYQDQYVEVDARAFANLFTEAMKYE